MKLDILRRLCQFFSLLQLRTLYKDLIRPFLLVLDRVESKALRFIDSSSLTDCLQPFSRLRNV
ncbi:hypothetical protein E2C01_014843 [Portunus trituberculatus]|uniref:Uncharacterized protein n=1 Tax=Portunus trituberculatus TaxID=210409 RepID=A0A5B7DJT6_PORTR|nr:hypothetical protein [Portunus trituberculatus]